MKHVHILSLLCAALSLPLPAQTITGRLVDERHNPLPYANIALLSLPDSTFVTGTVSRSDGGFSLAADTLHGSLLRISSVGYTTLYRRLPSYSDLGVLMLAHDARLLDEVVVKSRLPKTRIQGDAFVTTVEGTLLAEAGSAGDVLEHIPAVTRKDENFEVFGKGMPTIYINGRQVRDVDELERLNSSYIRRVELVTNPGARYDASVKSVIRIRTRRQKGDGFGFDLRSTYTYADRSQWHEQANLNYRHDGLDVFGKLTFRDTYHVQESRIAQTTHSGSVWQQVNDMTITNRNRRIDAETGLNYVFSEDHSAGVRYSIQATPHAWTHAQTGSDVWENDAFYDRWKSQMRNERDYRPTHRLNAYYSGRFGNLSVDWDADYYTNRNDSHSTTHEDSQAQDDRDVNSANHVDNRLWATKLALSHPLAGGTLAFGGEYAYTRRHDDYLSENEVLPTSRSRIREQNVAAYVEYSHVLPLGMLTAGLRFEHVGFDYFQNGRRMDDQCRNYDDWFPNVSYTLPLGDLQLQASYTAKTERPDYQSLSNNVGYINRFTYQTGNPALKPAVVHDVSFTAAWKFFTAMVSYQRRRDDILYWSEPLVDNSAVTMVRNKNIDVLPVLAAYIGATPVVGWWNPNIMVGVRRQWLTLDTSTGRCAMDKLMPTVQWGNVFAFPRKWRLGIDLSFRGKGYYQNVHAGRNVYGIDLMLRKSWMGDALSVELRGRDLLRSEEKSVVRADRLLVDQLNRINSRQCTVTLRYKFNAAKNKYKGKGAGNSEIERM